MVQKFINYHALYWHSNILSLLEIQVTDETYELLCCLLPVVAEFTLWKIFKSEMQLRCWQKYQHWHDIRY